MIIETSHIDGDWIKGKTWSLVGSLEDLIVEYCREWMRLTPEFYANHRGPTDPRVRNEAELRMRLRYPMSPEDLADIVMMISWDLITNEIGKVVLTEVLATKKSPGEIVFEKNLWKAEDNGEVDAFIKDLVAKSETQVAQWTAGEAKILGWFTGQVMRAFKGKVSGDEVKTKLLDNLPKVA